MQVLSRLAEKMKRDVDVGLGADFRRFHQEKAATSRARVADDPSLSLYMERRMCVSTLKLQWKCGLRQSRALYILQCSITQFS